MKITSETKLKELLEREDIFEILMAHGFPCVTCPMARMEMDILEIGAVCEMYGIDQISLLEDLNEFLEKKEK
ncbi:MAG: DUF1858 domain-containing protein [Candidatus ainarchaeum sp.]|jgi:hypothetical protein|nr:DUF1858 domain-containing protein [Candidatus ainarchaeum sp.]NCP71813.1 DUF1858 domain-containing protein [archaeon]NCP78988.1 DUF1858 domain-containing protein [archaeon]NCP97629.1 DUF1858 domain-containing protein [archaeon]NCQ06755.1 DUF1858 domain-containing protein [archaeon]